MDHRTEHLVALVKDGATLREAARFYGISGERVRQLLKEGGVSVRELPGRGQKPRSNRSALSHELAPVIEAMWRAGMLHHEIAKVFDTSREAIHRLICERVPEVERSTRTAGRREDGRSTEERLLDGMREAESVLAQTGFLEAGARRHAQAVVSGWLAAHAQLLTREAATPPAGPTDIEAAHSPLEPFSSAELSRALERFKADLRAGGLRESTIDAYLLGSSLFVRWLRGDYVPGSRRADRAPAGRTARPM